MKNLFRRLTVLLSLAAIVTFAWFAPLDAPAIQQVDAGLKRALVSFATARALNGVISVLQGTQIDIQPGGLGATFAPGQIVAPINELVRHFANLMLAASIAFGIQKVLISISAYWVISLVLTLLAGAWAASHFRQRRPPRLLSRALVLLLMLRFAIPLVTLGSDCVSRQFLAADYATSQQAIDQAAGQAAKVQPPGAPVADNNTWWGKWSKSLPTVPDFDAMKHAVEQSTEHMVRLMAIFLLQTLVLPLLLLWGLYAAAKGVLAAPPRPPTHP